MSHFFSSILPGLALVTPTSLLPLPELRRQGQKDFACMNEFFRGFRCLSLHQKRLVVESFLENDNRPDARLCSCPGCMSSSVQAGDIESLPQGLLYGPGIQLTCRDRIRMTANFGLYCVAATSILRLLPVKHSGISTPLLYYGTTHSMFQAHIETFSLYSWNYLHFGSPKVWFVM